jgi:phosphatidylserine synthase
VYLFSLEAVLGIISIWSIMASLAMLVVSSSKYPALNLHKFSVYSAVFIAGGFVFVLCALVYPYSPSAMVAILVGSLIIYGLYLRASNRDLMDRQKNQVRTNGTTTSVTSPTNVKKGGEDSPPPPTPEANK